MHDLDYLGSVIHAWEEVVNVQNKYVCLKRQLASNVNINIYLFKLDVHYIV